MTTARMNVTSCRVHFQLPTTRVPPSLLQSFLLQHNLWQLFLKVIQANKLCSYNNNYRNICYSYNLCMCQQVESVAPSNQVAFTIIDHQIKHYRKRKKCLRLWISLTLLHTIYGGVAEFQPSLSMQGILTSIYFTPTLCLPT